MRLRVLAAAGILFAAQSHAGSLDSPEARTVVSRMIEAHGGMGTWKSAPTVSFDDTWDNGETAHTTVEQGRRRVYIDYPTSGARLAWDGERAWSESWREKTPPRFLVLLSFYFANLPWLTQDPGVVLATPGRGRIPGDPVEYVTIKMTFEAGTGDTPDDYYVLYIHPEVHRLHACEYIVTYQAILPPGPAATAPHLLIYDKWTTIDGLTVPARFTIYEGDKVYASCALENWSFQKPFDTTRMQMPKSATLDTSQP